MLTSVAGKVYAGPSGRQFARFVLYVTLILDHVHAMRGRSRLASTRYKSSQW
jgi:hypothetical protein